MNRNNQNKMRDYILCLLLSAGSVAGLAFLLRRLWVTIATGSSSGKMGAVYFYPSTTYFMHVFFLFVGIGLAIFLLKQLIGWLINETK